MLGSTLRGTKSPFPLTANSKYTFQPPFGLHQTEWDDIGLPGEKEEPPALSAHVGE